MRCADKLFALHLRRDDVVPALVIVEMARNSADWPEAVATAARPPSNAAIRFLNTSCRDRQVYKESSEVEKK